MSRERWSWRDSNRLDTLIRSPRFRESPTVLRLRQQRYCETSEGRVMKGSFFGRRGQKPAKCGNCVAGV